MTESRKFFVPAVEDRAQAEGVWEATRAFAHDQLAWDVSDRRIFQINYQHNGRPYVAEVGLPDARTGETLLVILESNAYLVCTENRGVVRGEPIIVGREQVRTVEDFAPPSAQVRVRMVTPGVRSICRDCSLE
jgi:hypothetical protein